MRPFNILWVTLFEQFETTEHTFNTRGPFYHGSWIKIKLIGIEIQWGLSNFWLTFVGKATTEVLDVFSGVKDLTILHQMGI